MTWSYGGQPDSDVVDEVHLLVGDTDATEPLVQNEEITYLLTLYPKPAGKPAYLAGAAAADAIAAQFARRAQRSVGSLSIAAQQQYEHYKEVAQMLRTAYATNGEGNPDGGPLRVRPGIPRLGGGGRTYLGDNQLPSGGSGTM